MVWQYKLDGVVHAVRANHSDAVHPYIQIWCSAFDLQVADEPLYHRITTNSPVTCLGCIDKMEWW